MKNEITEAILDLKQAEQNFQYASPEFVEIAIFQLVAAECKVNTLIRLKIKDRKKADPSRENPLKANWLEKLFNDIVPQQEQAVKREIQVHVVNSASNQTKRLTVIGKNF